MSLRHHLTTVSTIYKILLRHILQSVLQGSLQEDTTRIPLQSLVQNTLQRKPCCMLQLELQGSYTKSTTFY